MVDLVIKLEALGEFSTVMQTRDEVEGLHNCLEFCQPLSCLYQAIYANTANVFYCLNIFVFVEFKRNFEGYLLNTKL